MAQNRPEPAPKIRYTTKRYCSALFDLHLKLTIAMMLFYLPVELLLYVGRYLSGKDQISLATTCKGIRRALMVQIFGGTVQIRSPFSSVPHLFKLPDYLHQGMPGLQKCIDQVAFYQQQGHVARSVHTVQITNWIAPRPRCFWSMASSEAQAQAEWDWEPEYEYHNLLQKLRSNQDFLNALRKFCSVYDLIVVNLVQLWPISELRLIRTHITVHMHFTLSSMPTLRRLVLEDCSVDGTNPRAYAGHGGQYESFKVISGKKTYLQWTDSFMKELFIRAYLFSSCSRLTNLEISVEFLRDEALDRLFLPSLTSLAIVPPADFGRWSWSAVYRILKSSPNITCFKFELRPALYPFSESRSDWKEYKRRIGNLSLSQLSSITAYRQLVKRLVPGRPVSFVKILLFPDVERPETNWPDPESDDEVTGNDVSCYFKEKYIVPYQLVRSATPIKTLYLQCIDEQIELNFAEIWIGSIQFLRDACPYLTDLWIPSLKITSRRRHYRDPVDMVEVLHELTIWHNMERCAIGSCSPWIAKELEWYREGTIVRERVHPTLEELLLGIDVLWKWQDDTEVTGWVLYVTTHFEESGSEDSEEGIIPSGSPYADSVSSERPETDLE